MVGAAILLLLLLAFGGLLAWLVHCGGHWRTTAFILGRPLIAVVVFAGVATAVVYGNHLGDVQLTDPAVDVPLSAALWWWLLLAAVLLVFGRIPLPSGSKMDVIR